MANLNYTTIINITILVYKIYVKNDTCTICSRNKKKITIYDI